MEIGSSIDKGTSVKKKTGFTYHIGRTRRWLRPDINFRMKHEMSDNNSVNFWRTKMVHLFLEFPVQGLWSQHGVIGALESSVYTKKSSIRLLGRL